MQELHHVSRWQNMVQWARGPGHVLHKRHGPQTSRPSHQVLFRNLHCRCGGYISSDEDPLQRRWRDPTVYQRNGSSAAKIQAGKTLHSWRVYARCGAKIAASIRWDTGVVETPRIPTNLGGMENDLPGGLRCEATHRSRPGRERKPFWWFRSIRSCTWKNQRTTTEAITSKDRGSSPAHKSNYGLSGGIFIQYRSSSHTNGCKWRSACGISC